MIYRRLGRTSFEVSQLGFGAMRLPMIGEGKEEKVDLDLAIPLIHKAFEGGINYIDTAVFYCNNDSQKAVGEALKGWRDKIIVSTKNHADGRDEKEWWGNLEDSLKFLQVSCIDIYSFHAISWKGYLDSYKPYVSKLMQKAKDQGLIKHICCSFHDNNEALRNIIDTGEFASITLQYNMLDRKLENGIAHAHEQGIGVVVMGPIGGGRLGIQSREFVNMVPGIDRVPELALKFVLSNPGVSCAISGMSTVQQVEENLTVARGNVNLSNEEKSAITAQLDRLQKAADLYCSGCEYCLPCPIGVRIPHIFQLYNMGRVYGLWDHARERYKEIGNLPWYPGKTADECTECGQCEEKCPQNLKIKEQLKEAHRELS